MTRVRAALGRRFEFDKRGQLFIGFFRLRFFRSVVFFKIESEGVCPFTTVLIASPMSDIASVAELVLVWAKQ